MNDLKWAKKFVVELSNRLGDESDYEEKLLPKFERMMEILNENMKYLKEVEYTEEIKIYDENGNYMGMMGGHEVQK